MKKKDLEELVVIADELKEAALRVVGNEANRDLHQHIMYLADVALKYSDKRYS